jgi:hypothetical protein
MSDVPDFIIIGAMKCATSTLHDQLARQPGVFMSTPKEPNFFSNDEEYARGIEWYRSLFAGRAAEALCGESSTHYTKLPTYPHTVERMKKHLPRVKLIYVMRHPIDRLISHYIHDWTERKIDEPLERAVDRYPDLVDYGRYAMQLRPYLEAYGRGSVLTVFFERLAAEPQAVFERVCRFIGYGGQPRWVEEAEPQNVSRQRMRKSAVRDALVWNPVSTWLRRRLIPPSWRERVKGWYQMRERPTLREDQVQRLEAEFDRDLAELEPLIGLRVSCRTWKAVAGRA